jgi:putative transposase
LVPDNWCLAPISSVSGKTSLFRQVPADRGPANLRGMPRRHRRLVPDGYYHLINRGNDRSLVFHDWTDYRVFLNLIDEAQDRVPLRLLAYCLMPNHFHLVASPGSTGDISRWMHWLLTTHTHRHHLRHGTSGCVWQGRFKSFPVKNDSHLLVVMRYVERNALRAGLVSRAEHWPWGSLAWRLTGLCDGRLADPPITLPADWFERVNEAHTPSELEELRNCVRRQCPFGDEQWIRDNAQQLGWNLSARRPGRPPNGDSHK